MSDDPAPLDSSITPLISTLALGGRIFGRAMTRITVEGAIDEIPREGATARQRCRGIANFARDYLVVTAGYRTVYVPRNAVAAVVPRNPAAAIAISTVAPSARRPREPSLGSVASLARASV